MIVVEVVGKAWVQRGILPVRHHSQHRAAVAVTTGGCVDE